MKLTPSEPDVDTIVERIDRGDIDLQPDFQRQEVWSTAKKKKLVDTVLRGWSIPPIHLVETQDNRLEVLDGQQRLAALRDFIQNRFSIDGNITPSDPAVHALHGKFYKHLDVSTRRRVDQYPIRCFRITDYQPEEPSELFYRLNQPTILTAGEQRNALYGPARVQMKELVRHFADGQNSRETIGFSNNRLAYDDIFARLLFFLEQGSFGAKSTEAIISERFRSKIEFPDKVISRAFNAVDSFSTARSDAPPYRFNKASILSWLMFYSRFDLISAPTYFLGTFINLKSGQNTAGTIAEALSIFDDRSSLRVTDVSSVVYRDFILFFLFKTLNDEVDLPPQIQTDIIDEVGDYVDLLGPGLLHIAMDNLLPIDRWSSSL